MSNHASSPLQVLTDGSIAHQAQCLNQSLRTNQPKHLKKAQSPMRGASINSKPYYAEEVTSPISHYTNNEMQEYTDLYVDFVLEQFNLAKQKCKDPLFLLNKS